MSNNEIKPNEPLLFQDLRNLIEESRKSVATVVNATLTMLYWDIGKRINKEVLQGERAEYGKQIVAMLSQQLTEEYGKGFADKNLRRMMQFAAVLKINKLSYRQYDN